MKGSRREVLIGRLAMDPETVNAGIVRVTPVTQYAKLYQLVWSCAVALWEEESGVRKAQDPLVDSHSPSAPGFHQRPVAEFSPKLIPQLPIRPIGTWLPLQPLAKPPRPSGW